MVFFDIKSIFFYAYLNYLLIVLTIFKDLLGFQYFSNVHFETTHSNRLFVVIIGWDR